MSHFFKRTPRTKLVQGKTYTIFTCSKCRSEVAFDGRLSDGDVNRAVEIKWPKLLCISGDLAN